MWLQIKLYFIFLVIIKGTYVNNSCVMIWMNFYYLNFYLTCVVDSCFFFVLDQNNIIFISFYFYYSKMYVLYFFSHHFLKFSQKNELRKYRFDHNFPTVSYNTKINSSFYTFFLRFQLSILVLPCFFQANINCSCWCFVQSLLT